MSGTEPKRPHQDDVEATRGGLDALLGALLGDAAAPSRGLDLDDIQDMLSEDAVSASHKQKPKPASASHELKPSSTSSIKPKPLPKPPAKPSGSTKPKTSGKHSTVGNKRSTGGG